MQQIGLICHINQSDLLFLSAQKVDRKNCLRCAISNINNTLIAHLLND
jgi:hypothetical protein